MCSHLICSGLRSEIRRTFENTRTLQREPFNDSILTSYKSSFKFRFMKV